MPIAINEIRVGGYYSAGKKCDQLRKVTEIKKDDKNRNRVIYVSKSIKIKNRTFSFAATLANPALEQTFASACCKELTSSEIDALRNNSIILASE